MSKEQQATQILVIISENQALLCQININTYVFKEESLFKNADSFHDYFYHSPEIRSWSVFGLYKTRGPELMGEGGGEGSKNVRLFVSCQLKIIRGFNKHRRPTKRVGYMAQRSRLLFPPKRKQLQSSTKLLRKLHTWGALFLNFLADRFFPTPLPLKAVLLGLQKKAGSLKHL